MKSFGVLILAAIVGYAGGFAIRMGLVNLFSSNRHDTSMEAAMTGAFVVGPLMAVAAVIVTVVMHTRRPVDPSP